MSENHQKMNVLDELSSMKQLNLSWIFDKKEKMNDLNESVIGFCAKNRLEAK